MTTRRYVVVPGTRSLCSDPSPMPHPGHWWEHNSPHEQLMRAHGLIAMEETFEWSGDLDGVFGWFPWRLPKNLFGIKDHRDWKAGGSSLRYYLRNVPYEDRNLVIHSHGLQVALFAAAGSTLRKPTKIRRMISIGSPLRLDDKLREVAERARPNIEQWWHVFDPTERDVVQLAGGIGDGKLSLRRIQPKADKNIAIIGIGHTGLLKNPATFSHWTEKGLIEFLRT